jgi:hypothetical protein
MLAFHLKAVDTSAKISTSPCYPLFMLARASGRAFQPGLLVPVVE